MTKYIKRFLNTDTKYIQLADKKLTLEEAVAEALQKLDALNKKPATATTTSIQPKPQVTNPGAAQPTQPPAPTIPAQQQVPPQPGQIPAGAQQPAQPQQSQQSGQQQNQVTIDPQALQKLQDQNKQILDQTTAVVNAQAEQAKSNPGSQFANSPNMQPGTSQNARIGSPNHIESIPVGANQAPGPATTQATTQPQPKPNVGIKAKQRPVAESTESVMNADTLALVNPFKLTKKSVKRKAKPALPEEIPCEESPCAIPEVAEELSAEGLPPKAIKLLSDPVDFSHLEQLLKSIIDDSGLNDVMGDNIVIQVPKTVQKAKITVDIEKALDMYNGETDKVASELLKDGPIRPVSPVTMQQLKGGSPRMDDARAEINAPREILPPEDDPEGFSVAGLQDDVAFKFF